MDFFWQVIYQSLLDVKPVIVATIISNSGSTPRTSGSKMVICDGGGMVGTIGGGFIEGDVIRSAKELFGSGTSLIKSYNLNNEPGVAEMDLICGGRMQVLLESIPDDDKTIEMYRSLVEAGEKQRSSWMVGRLVSKNDPDNPGNLAVVRATQIENNSWVGPLQTSKKVQELLEQLPANKQTCYLVELDNQHYVIETIIAQKTVYLIGGGHVAKEISPLINSASFRSVVADDREEFANVVRFPHADEVLVCSKTRPLEDLAVDENSYIVIATRGHSLDMKALAQALRTNASYIGMIGSRRKRDQIYQMLQQEGFTLSDLERVHCPIGLSINAETPFEIGVSIVAELIHHRAKGKSSR